MSKHVLAGPNTQQLGLPVLTLRLCASYVGVAILNLKSNNTNIYLSVPLCLQLQLPTSQATGATTK